MDLNEIREKKVHLTNEITALINRFMNETDVRVVGVDIESIVRKELGSVVTRSYFLTGIKINTSIDYAN